MAPHSQDFMSSDFYLVLGVGRSVSTQEVKVAYRELAVKCHPEKHPRRREAAGEDFKKLHAAYEVLFCAQKREEYDRANPSEQGTPAGNPQAAIPPQSRQSRAPQPGKPRDFPEAGQPSCRPRSRTPQPDPSRDKSPAPPNRSSPEPRKKEGGYESGTPSSYNWGVSRAFLCGLIGRFELNGQSVVLLGPARDKRIRIQVVGSGEEIAVKQKNLNITYNPGAHHAPPANPQSGTPQRSPQPSMPQAGRPQGCPQSGQQNCHNDGNPQSGTHPSRPSRAKSPSPPSRPSRESPSPPNTTHGHMPGSPEGWMLDYVLRGFKSRPELNGQTAVLVRPDGERFIVMWESDWRLEEISVKLGNLWQ